MRGADGFDLVNMLAQDASTSIASQHNSEQTPQQGLPKTLSARTQSRYSIERLQLLCRLHFNPAVLLPEIFSNLRNVIPALAATIVWNSDVNGMCVATESADHFAMSKQIQREEPVWQCLQDHVSARSGVGACRVILGAVEPLHAALLAHAPQFLSHIVDHPMVMVSLCAAQQVIGCIALYRITPGIPFSTHEQALLADFAAPLAITLHTEDVRPNTFCVPSNVGTILLDSGGRILHVCAGAQRLICLASVDLPSVPHNIDTLWGQLWKIHATELCDSATTSCIHLNACGRFMIQSHRLSPLFERAHLGTTMVTITHYLPLTFNILRQCERLALPPKQTQIAIYLVQGDSYDAIATQLDISPHTVIDHTRKLQERLGARNRGELMAKLVAG